MATLPLIQSGRMENIGIPGAVTPNVQAPQIDYVGLRQAAASQQQVAQTLDRLSASLFRTAGEEAQRAGLQYAADNPVTEDQLQAAMQGDTTPLTQRQGGTIFDQAVRKARALELSGRFEAEARKQLTGMLSAIESGDPKASTEGIQVAINTMMDGMSKSLAQIDPEASLKFRASIATSGNTVLQKAAEQQLKREKAARQIRFDSNFDNVTRLIEAEIAQGFWIDPATGTKRSIEERLGMYRTAISNEALLLGDTQMAKTYGDRFDVAVKNAKINVVTKELITNPAAMADPEATIRKLITGDAGKMSDVVKVMLATDFASVEKISANFMTAVNNANTLAERRRQEVKRQGEAQAVNLLEQIFPLQENDPKRRALVKQLIELPEGSVPIGVLKDVLSPTQPEGNPQVEFNLLQGIYGGTITSPSQIWDRVGKGITGKQAVSLLKVMTSEDRRDQRDLDSGLAKLAGIPTMPGQVTVIDPKGAEFTRLQTLRADAQQIQAEATRKGEILTPRQILERVEGDLTKRRSSEVAKDARKQLTDVYEKRPWVNGPITRDSLPALERKAGNDAAKLRELTQIKRLLDQAEGNQ